MKKNNQSGIAEVALVVVLLGIVLVVGGIAFVSLNNTSPLPTDTKSDATPMPLPTDRVPDMEMEEVEISDSDDMDTLEAELDATLIETSDTELDSLIEDASTL